MKKLLVLSLICCLSIVLFADNNIKYDILLSRTTNVIGSPQAIFHKVRIDRNVKVNGRKGMKIHVNFNVNNIKNRTCQIIAYFYTESGKSLKDKNLKYRTRTGEVCTPAKDLKPGHDKTWYKDLVIFMPYSELHVNGSHKIKFRLGVYYNRQFIGFSKFSKFNIISKSSDPTPDNCLDVSSSSVIKQINAALSGLKLKLDRNGYISFAGYKKSIKLPEIHLTKPGYDWKFYIQNINTKKVSIKPVGNKLKLKIEFEGEGSEVKGTRKSGIKRVRDKRVPDINWKGDRSIEIIFRPVVRSNSISLEKFEVKVNGSVQINGKLDNIYDVFFSPEKYMTAKLKEAASKAFKNNYTIQTKIADAIRPGLKRLGIKSFKSVSVRGSKIRFCK